MTPFILKSIPVVEIIFVVALVLVTSVIAIDRPKLHGRRDTSK